MKLRPKVRGHTGRIRKGKGFSLAELKELGLSVREARKLGIAVDLRRKSKREDNIKMLREYLSRKDVQEKEMS